MSSVILGLMKFGPSICAVLLSCCLVERKTASGRVDCSQSHSVRSEFLTAEDAVAVTHGGCRRVTRYLALLVR